MEQEVNPYLILEISIQSIHIPLSTSGIIDSKLVCGLKNIYRHKFLCLLNAPNNFKHETWRRKKCQHCPSSFHVRNFVNRTYSEWTRRLYWLMCKSSILYMTVSQGVFRATLGFRENISIVATFFLFAFTKTLRAYCHAARSILSCELYQTFRDLPPCLHRVLVLNVEGKML
jgi:hypothetical protein